MEATVSYLLILLKYIISNQIKHYALCLGNISKDLKKSLKETGIKGVLKFFSAGFDPIDANDVLDIHKHLMKKT